MDLQNLACVLCQSWLRRMLDVLIKKLLIELSALILSDLFFLIFHTRRYPRPGFSVDQSIPFGATRLAEDTVFFDLRRRNSNLRSTKEEITREHRSNQDFAIEYNRRSSSVFICTSFKGVEALVRSAFVGRI